MRHVLGWEVLDRVLAAREPAPDVLVVARGALLELPAPRSLAELRAPFGRGIGICARRTERCDPGLAQVAALSREAGRAHVQVFATPASTYGFGWHYDDEDVFIVQTAGVKDYYFRNSTVAREPARGSSFRKFAHRRCAARR